MATLNPSRFPFLTPRTSKPNRTVGAAVHTAAPPIVSDPNEAPLSASSSEEGDDEGHPCRWQRRQRRARRRAKEETKAEGMVPVLPIPDMRFEQGYLLSVSPFLHLDEPKARAERAPSGKQTEPEKINEEKVRAVEDTALVSIEGASGKPILYFDPNLRVEWGMLLYVTFRDQFAYPLLQGAVWGSLSLFLGQLWAVQRQATPILSKARHQSGAGRPVGEPRGLWERCVGSIWRGIETNQVLRSSAVSPAPMTSTISD